MKQQSQRMFDLVCMNVIPKADNTTKEKWHSLITETPTVRERLDRSFRGIPNFKEVLVDPPEPRRPPAKNHSNASRLFTKIKANPFFQRTEHNLVVEDSSSGVETRYVQHAAPGLSTPAVDFLHREHRKGNLTIDFGRRNGAEVESNVNDNIAEESSLKSETPRRIKDSRRIIRFQKISSKARIRQEEKTVIRSDNA